MKVAEKNGGCIGGCIKICLRELYRDLYEVFSKKEEAVLRPDRRLSMRQRDTQTSMNLVQTLKRCIPYTEKDTAFFVWPKFWVNCGIDRSSRS